MHEMAIAQSVLDIALGELERNAAKRVQKIKISIGELSGVVKEALEFAFDVLKNDTAAADAIIEIEVTPLAAECPACGPVTCRLNDLCLMCPHCETALKITGGRQMKVDYLDIE